MDYNKYKELNTYGISASDLSSWLKTGICSQANTISCDTTVRTAPSGAVAIRAVPASEAINPVSMTKGHATVTNITVMNDFGDRPDFDATIQIRTDSYNAVNKFVDLVNKTIDFEKENDIMPTKAKAKATVTATTISNKTLTEKTLAKKSFTIPAIKHVTYNKTKGKECVVVIFEDGTSVVQKMSPNDQFDLSVGVALALATKVFGTKTQFHKVIEAKDSVAKKERKAAKKAKKN